MPELRLVEWATCGPEVGALQNRELDAEGRLWAERLAAGRVLEVTELRRGLRVRSFAHVGRVRLGDLTITIEPKLAPDLLLGLLQFAFGLRNLRLLGDAQFDSSSNLLADLIVHQLYAEARELVARGLHRDYREEERDLAVPRGRLDTRRLVLAMSSGSSRLPYREYPRTFDHELNRALRAGLVFAGGICASPALAVAVRRLSGELEEVVAGTSLDRALLDRAERSLSRMTQAYEPALRLIRLLHAGSSISLDEDEATTLLPGFLFDMNRFFEALVGRLLRGHLAGATVEEQRRLTGLMQYVPGFNPRQRRAPTPRPDFVLTRGAQVVTILDAKYRNLWDDELPRDMLYQLSLYALSQPPGFTAAMVYPCDDPAAREARVEVRTLGKTGVSTVSLRPLHLPELMRGVQAEQDGRPKELALLARRVACGEGSRTATTTSAQSRADDEPVGRGGVTAEAARKAHDDEPGSVLLERVRADRPKGPRFAGEGTS